MTSLAGDEVTEMSLFVIVAVLEELGCLSQPSCLLRPPRAFPCSHCAHLLMSCIKILPKPRHFDLSHSFPLAVNKDPPVPYAVPGMGMRIIVKSAT